MDTSGPVLGMGPRTAGAAARCRLRGSVDVLAGVVDVELARRRHDPRVVDDGLELPRLVVDHDDGALLVLAVPDREPDLGAVLVVLALDDTALALGDAGPLA